MPRTEWQIARPCQTRTSQVLMRMTPRDTQSGQHWVRELLYRAQTQTCNSPLGVRTCHPARCPLRVPLSPALRVSQEQALYVDGLRRRIFHQQSGCPLFFHRAVRRRFCRQLAVLCRSRIFNQPAVNVLIPRQALLQPVLAQYHRYRMPAVMCRQYFQIQRASNQVPRPALLPSPVAVFHPHLRLAIQCLRVCLLERASTVTCPRPAHMQQSSALACPRLALHP